MAIATDVMNAGPPSATRLGSVSRRDRQLLFWLLALAVLVLLLRLFSSILMPFVTGMALAYVLDPLKSWLQRHGFGRRIAALCVTALLVAFLLLAPVLILPWLASEVGAFVERMPELAERLRSLFDSLLDSRFAQLLGINAKSIPDYLSGLLNPGVAWFPSFIGSLWTSGASLVSFLTLFLITPVVVFYLLLDWDRLAAFVDKLLPRAHADAIRAVGREIDDLLAAFVRGQGLICLILGAFYGLGMALVGIKFGFPLGFAAGLISFIPFAGTALGLLGSVGLALAEYWPDWIPAAMAVAVFAIGQILNDYVLVPRLIGSTVRLHPVWLLFSLFAFQVLLGFVGLVIAIPAAAAIGVLVRHGIAQYLASPLYLDRRPLA
jgi:predicted PurR-regulated permease PerM